VELQFAFNLFTSACYRLATMATTQSRPPLPTRTSSGNLPSSSTRNPLNLKVHRLLSSNLEDAGTRAALDTLGELEKAELESDKSAQGRGIGAALKRGTGLRKEVDGRMAQGSKEFLQAFSEVNDVRSMVFSEWNNERRLTFQFVRFSLRWNRN